MKKTKKIALLAVCMLAFTSIAGTASQKMLNAVSVVNYKFVINGEEKTVPKNIYILSKNNTTYVPIRFVSESLGSMVNFSNGTITIEDTRYTRDKDSGKIVPIEADRKKLDESLKEIEELKKENETLKKQVAQLEKQYNSFNAYKKLPVAYSDAQGFKVTLNTVSSVNDKVQLNVILDNTDKDNLFYFLPDKTELVFGASAGSSPTYTTNLLSTVMPARSGQSSILGEINFSTAYEKNVKGSVTFYYRVNSDPTVRSTTLFFDTTR